MTVASSLEMSPEKPTRRKTAAAAKSAAKPRAKTTKATKTPRAKKAAPPEEPPEPAVAAAAPTLSDARLKTAQKRLGYQFQNESLLSEALCHASTRNEGISVNERLEFLGDAVLSMLVSWFLYEGMKDADEGALSTRRARMTQGEALSRIADHLKLGELLRTGKGQDLAPTPNMAADAVEACIGAIFLDGGLPAAQNFVLQHVIASYKPDEPAYNDPKSRLQHFTLAHRLGLPEYRLVESKGPPHAQIFEVEIVVAGRALARGNGTSKKSAQQNAAAAALRLLEQEEAAKSSGGPGK